MRSAEDLADPALAPAAVIDIASLRKRTTSRRSSPLSGRSQLENEVQTVDVVSYLQAIDERCREKAVIETVNAPGRPFRGPAARGASTREIDGVIGAPNEEKRGLT